MSASPPPPDTGLAGSISSEQGSTLLTLIGEIDLVSAPTLRDLLDRADSAGHRHLVVDMAGVLFCDGRGLAELIRANERLRARDGQLSVRRPTNAVRRLLSVTGQLALLEVRAAPSPEPHLLHALTHAAQLPLVRGVVDAGLELAVRMAQAVLAAADGVSITLPRDGRLRTVAWSNDVVLHMDHDQYDTHEGPCLTAATTGVPVHIASLAEESRWPAFVPRAEARGIRSIMSTPLMALGSPLGALNVYSRTAEAFADHEQQWAGQFAAEASKVLLAAGTTAELEDLGRDLTEALRSRELIALAQGIVMTRRNLRPDAAHRFLVDISRSTGRPLLGICEDVVRTVTARSPGRGGDDDPAP